MENGAFAALQEWAYDLATLEHALQKITGYHQYSAMRKSGGHASINSLCRWIDETLENAQSDGQIGAKLVAEARDFLRNMVPLVALAGNRPVLTKTEAMETLQTYPSDWATAENLLFFAPSRAFLTRHKDMDWQALDAERKVKQENPGGRKKPLAPGMYT